MNIHFAKMHGLGNDFMVLDLVSQALDFTAEQVQRWADRHTGVGFDQLLIIQPPNHPEADFGYRIFNADGTPAEQCGNGARCVAKYIHDTGLSVKEVIRFETSNGHIETRMLDRDQVEVDMGVPLTGASDVPFDASAARSSTTDPDGRCTRYFLNPGDSDRVENDDRVGIGDCVELIAASIGNPHGVLFVENIASAPVSDLGSLLTRHPFFPDRANIGFCQVVDTNFVRLRVFERAVGETRACGTGACAAVVAGRLSGRLEEQVKVSLPGGKVRIRWQGEGSPVKMTGPATLVYEGQISLN
jgi:diaminopimelate epimerase